MGSKDILLEIITPEEMFFSGQVEMLVASTLEGDEGFLYGHTWCCKLLKEEGRVKLRKSGEKEVKTAKIKGGYVDIKDSFVVYTDDAEWEQM